jgi:hypothetical protein
MPAGFEDETSHEKNFGMLPGERGLRWFGKYSI